MPEFPRQAWVVPIRDRSGRVSALVVVDDIRPIPAYEIPDVAREGIRPVPAAWRGVPDGLRPFAGITHIGRGLLPGVVGAWLGEQAAEHWKEWLSPEYPVVPAHVVFPGSLIANCYRVRACMGGPPIRWVSLFDGPPLTDYQGGCAADCFGGQVFAGNLMGTGTVPIGHNVVQVYWQVNVTPRMKYAQVFLSPSAAARPGPQWWKHHDLAPWAEPSWVAELDPFSQPVGEFQPFAEPVPRHMLPRWRPNPFRDAHEQPRFGPAPRGQPRTWVRTRPRTWVRTGGEPTVVVESPAHPGPPVVPPHRREPPRRRDAEGKFKAGPSLARAVFAAVHAVTESVDVLEALWEALPPYMRQMRPGRRTTPQEKVADLRNAWAEWGRNNHDASRFWRDAVQNLFENEVEDRFYGTLGRTPGLGRGNAVGIHAGPWDSQPRRRPSQEERQQRRDDRRWGRFGGYTGG